MFYLHLQILHNIKFNAFFACIIETFVIYFTSSVAVTRSNMTLTSSLLDFTAVIGSILGQSRVFYSNDAILMSHKQKFEDMHWNIFTAQFSVDDVAY